MSTKAAVHAVALCALAVFCMPPGYAQRGVQVNVGPNGQNVVGDAANEPTIAISPADPHLIVVGWRQFNTVTSDKRFAGYGHSADGGQTWKAGILATPPNQPPNSGQTDPVLEVDHKGIFYYWSEVFEPTPDTAQYVYRSLDGGQSWSPPTQVENPAVDGDKPWVAIDRTGGMGTGHVYGGWTSFAGPGYTVFTRSTSGGQTFSPPVRIADLGGSQFMLHFAVGPDGELYAAWRHYASNSIFVTKSINAQDPNVKTPTFDALGPGGENGLDVKIDTGNDPGGLPINPVGFHQVWLGVDSTNGPRRGWVYCVWGDRRNDPSDVIFARSIDGGRTWVSGVRVNDDALGNGKYQWMIAMAVSPNGRLDVVWYDTRDDAADRRSALYYANSLDGGFTWSVNRRLSDSFDTTIGYPVQRKIGDYNQIISYNDAVHVAYAATHNNEQDVWYLRVPPFLRGDLNCNGAINNLDIDPFVLALTNPARYAQLFPNCDRMLADCNGDGIVNNFDIDPFVELLTP